MTKEGTTITALSTTEVKSTEITPDVTSSTETTSNINSEIKSKKDISVRDIFSASQGEAVSLPGKFFGDVLCLPEFGGKIKEGRGVVFMISDYRQNKKKAMRIVKHPFKNGKVAFIPANMMDKVVITRQKANRGVFSTIFEYTLIEVNGAYDSFIGGIVKEKGYGPFLPRSIDDQFKMAVYDKLQSTETIPLYCKCFKSININNWSGLKVNEIDKPKAVKFNEKQMLKEIIYTKVPTVFVINIIIKENSLLMEWRLHEVNFKTKIIGKLIKLWDKEILLNNEINKGELMFNSSGNKIKEIVQKYGIQADKEGREYYLLSALR